jgi:effector-binding domain-containing protein
MTTTTQLESMEVEVPPTPAAQLDSSCRSDPESIAAAMGAAYGELGVFLQSNGIEPSGPPRAIYTSWDADGARFTAAFPIAEMPDHLTGAGAVRIETIPGGRALRFTHRGSYDALHDTYARIDEWLRERGAVARSDDWARYAPMWEEYVNAPGSVPDSELVTRIYLPLR